MTDEEFVLSKFPRAIAVLNDGIEWKILSTSPEERKKISGYSTHGIWSTWGPPIGTGATEDAAWAHAAQAIREVEGE